MGSSFAQNEKGKKIVFSEIEPVNVLQVAEMMQKFGFKVTKVPVDHEGFLDMEQLKEAVDKETILVSISTVNNELGTIQNIKEAVKIVKDKNAHTLFHTDRHRRLRQSALQRTRLKC
jgi:cysteine desulfurase